MNIFRRNMLIANTFTEVEGGGGNSLFPLYLDFDRREDLGVMVYYTRDPDESTIQLLEFLSKNAEYAEPVYYNDNIVGYIFDENTLNSLDIEIYFKGKKTITIEYSVSSDFWGPSTLTFAESFCIETLFGEEYLYFVFLRHTGEIYYEG